MKKRISHQIQNRADGRHLEWVAKIFLAPAGGTRIARLPAATAI